MWENGNSVYGSDRFCNRANRLQFRSRQFGSGNFEIDNKMMEMIEIVVALHCISITSAWASERLLSCLKKVGFKENLDVWVAGGDFWDEKRSFPKRGEAAQLMVKSGLTFQEVYDACAVGLEGIHPIWAASVGSDTQFGLLMPIIILSLLRSS